MLLGLQIPSRRGRKLPSLSIGSLVLGSLEIFSILRAGKWSRLIFKIRFLSI